MDCCLGDYSSGHLRLLTSGQFLLAGRQTTSAGELAGELASAKLQISRFIAVSHGYCCALLKNK